MSFLSTIFSSCNMASESHAATFTKCSRRGFFTVVQIPQLPVRARVEKGSEDLSLSQSALVSASIFLSP